QPGEPGRRNTPLKTTRITTLALIATATGVAIFFRPATVHAEAHTYTFQSPSGEIVCKLTTRDDGTGGVFCDIGSYWAPPYAPECDQGWGYRFSLDQGSEAVAHCQQATIIPGSKPENRGLATLAYGKTASAGTITCNSEPTGTPSHPDTVTCTDSSTGHY